jgi:hypothetical protein
MKKRRRLTKLAMTQLPDGKNPKFKSSNAKQQQI